MGLLGVNITMFVFVVVEGEDLHRLVVRGVEGKGDL